MSARTERNIANVLTLLGLAPALIWLILVAMALSDALFPWISAGVSFSGKYLVVLSLCITGPVLIWASSLKVSHPDIWTSKHCIPAIAAKLILCFAILLNVGLWMWDRFHHTEIPTQVTLPAEENRRIQIQSDKKIREMEALRR